MRDTGMPSVNADQRAIGRAAAEHLLECGFRRFAYYGLKNTWYSDERRDAFIERIAEAGAKCSVLDVPNSVSRRQPWHLWLAKLERWLRTLKYPVGMLAVHDPRASLAVNTCLSLGLQVPDDVGVVGIENNEIVCEFARVKLSSVPVDNRRMGFEAAAMLDRIMIGEPPPTETAFGAAAGSRAPRVDERHRRRGAARRRRRPIHSRAPARRFSDRRTQGHHGHLPPRRSSGSSRSISAARRTSTSAASASAARRNCSSIPNSSP